MRAKADSALAARAYAFLLLKYRARSEKEIAQRLKRKKFNPQIIEQTIEFLKEKRFLDDDSFAKAWIESRIKKPLGLRRLKEELKIKGIGQEIIDDQINQIRANYSEEKIVSEIAQERIKKLKNIQLQKAKQRIFGYLVRRGFSPAIIIDTLNTL